jgi:hypothetical protein
MRELRIDVIQHGSVQLLGTFNRQVNAKEIGFLEVADMGVVQLKAFLATSSVVLRMSFQSG